MFERGLKLEGKNDVGGRSRSVDVARAQLTYVMQVFRILEGIIIIDIHSLMMNFWWGQKSAERRIHWIQWEEMIYAKEEGGMDFCNLSGFNSVLLAKQLWNLHTRPSSLVARMPKEKYFKFSCLGS